MVKEAGPWQLLAQRQDVSPTLHQQKQCATANEQASEAGLINAASQGLLTWMDATDLCRKPLKAEMRGLQAVTERSNKYFWEHFERTLT